MWVPVRRAAAALLMILWALGPAQVPAQRSPTVPATGQTTIESPDDKGGLRGGPRAPFAHHFFDGFSGAVLEPRNWETTAGATLTGDLVREGRVVAAVRLAADQLVAGSQPELRSVAIALESTSGAELSYAVLHRGVEAGERLVVEYAAENDEWYPIESVVADGRDSIWFSRRSRILPAEALHAGFRVRFRPQVDDPDDAWYLGEVAIVDYEPTQTLTVRVHPAHDARVQVIPEGQPDYELSGWAPFSRSLPADSRVRVVAAPVVDDWVFSHWSADDEPGSYRQRVLTLEMNRTIELEAHYRPWVPGRSEASVTIASTPELGVRIALGADSELLYATVIAGTKHPCLSDDWLALLAPPRTARSVFVGWIVNGQALPSGDNLLQHRVTGDDLLVARYVLLGDMNGDDVLDKIDVEEFVAALIDPPGYGERFPDLDLLLRGDINGDGLFDALDAEGFVDLLLNS